MQINNLIQNRALTNRNFDEQRRLSGDCTQLLNVIVRTESKRLKKEISFHSFRSNLAKVSLIKRSNSPIIMWDERFFDLAFDAVKKAVFVVEDQQPTSLISSHIADLYAHGGIYWSVDNPHLALVLQEISYSLRASIQDPLVAINDIQKNHAEYLFRIISMFCLLHEIGHLAGDELLDEYSLAVDVDSVKETYSDAVFQKQYNSNEQHHIKELAKCMEKPNVKRELQADIYAMRRLFEYEEIFMELRDESDDSENERLTATLLISEAMCLLHYVQSDLDFIKQLTTSSEKLQGHPINKLGIKQQMLLARGDVRIYLAAIFSTHMFDGSEQAANKIASAFGKTVPRYSTTYQKITLTAINQMMNHNRESIFSYENELRDRYPYQLARKTALDNIGW